MTQTSLDSFFAFTEQLVQFTPAEKDIVATALQVKTVPKQHNLVELGQVSEYAYFINQGCIRLYYLMEDGKEITGFVFTEQMFAGSLDSFLSQSPSTQALTTLEDSELLLLHHKNLQALYKTVPVFNTLMRKILEMRLIHAQKLVASLITHSPQDRYTAYKELHPDIEQRIPQHMLSSFMGITPVSLSRIRHRK